jgi:glycosyltransferase involved in cell wall biosynthesis
MNQSRTADFSLVIPCYNEGDSIVNTATRLVEEFRLRNVDFELILVDNGSRDNTGEVIDGLIAGGLPVRKVVVEANQGYGHGALTGLHASRGRWVGFSCADEQVEAHDVYKLYRLAASSPTPKLFKVHRRFRLEGPARRVISSTYNLLTSMLFGNLGTTDLNANPKLAPREYLEAMRLSSKDWFLDAEIMIKARMLGLPVFELNVFSLMRAEGASNVTPHACWEFLVNLYSHRFGQRKAIFRDLRRPERAPRERSVAIGAARLPS